MCVCECVCVCVCVHVCECVCVCEKHLFGDKMLATYYYTESCLTSSCARSARFATCARSSLRFNYFVLWSSASLLLHSTYTNL